jgi:hypothetical protein
MNGDRLLEIVTEAYLGSRHFNGFSFSRAAQTLPDRNSLTETVSGLVEAQRLELLFDGADENPALKRFRVAPSAEQVQQLQERGLMAAWAYPSPVLSCDRCRSDSVRWEALHASDGAR